MKNQKPELPVHCTRVKVCRKGGRYKISYKKHPSFRRITSISITRFVVQFKKKIVNNAFFVKYKIN